MLRNFFLLLTLLQLLFQLSLQSDSNNKTNLLRALPVQSSLSRMLNSNGVSLSQSSRIKFETYKALAGETIRLECPQPNPTWFFRRVSTDSSFNKLPNDYGKSGTEDLIVTRHGVINADYKYKIMCHMTLKHKVIIVNNVDFEDEGLYTCLYTLPSDMIQNSFFSKNNDVSANENTFSNFNGNLLQYRHVFNVTVYTLINGLSVNIKPISMRISPMLTSNEFLTNKYQYDKQNTNNNQIELVENTLTVRENEEFLFNCVVDSSKPAAEIRFSVMNILDSAKNSQDPLIPLTYASVSSLTSLVSSNTNIVKNSDRTFKSIYSARLKANLNDHGKTLTCNAENGFSNQKWENKKTLNVLFAPICFHEPNFVYFIGINQTLNVECRILNANPSRISYRWDLNNINGNINFQTSIQNPVKSQENLSSILKESNNHNDLTPTAERILNIENNKPSNSFQNSYHYNSEYNKVYATLESDSLVNRFKWKPSSLNDFGEIKCIASNEIGSTECVYELKLGGVPNPPTECNHILKNSSAIISCQVGFHQGDPDIYCYLLRKSDNGVYKEHTRNRESCSFIVNDINLNRLNEFWIYSSNKHGDNKDVGVHLTIGQLVKPVEQNNNRAFVMIAIALGLAVFVFLGCCFCFKIRKGFIDDTDSVFDTDAYQAKSQLDSKKNNANYPVKLIKGVKISNDSSYDINDHIKEIKPVTKVNEFKKQFNNQIANANVSFTDGKKRDSYINENKGYIEYSKAKQHPNYQQITRRIDDKKQIKLNLFKSTSTLPSHNRASRFEAGQLKPQTAQSYNHFDKLANGLHIATEKSVSNTILNDKNSTKMKKSISFTKSTGQHNVTGLDDTSPVDLHKETAPFFSKEKPISSSLLTTVASNTKLIQRSSKLSSNSISSLAESSILPSANKMVTFGNNNSSLTNNIMRKYPKSNQSLTTLTTAIVSTTTTTTTTERSQSNSDNSQDLSNNTSTTSPTCSSGNNDSEYLANSPGLNNNNSDLTSNSQSFTLHSDSSSLMLPKLNTFLPSNSNKKLNEAQNSSVNKFLNVSSSLSASPQSPTHNVNNRKSNDIIESKFLNKLCEEIEVSLNVDCECADDYSSNDFSGDYSFDNDLSNVLKVTNSSNHNNNINKTQMFSNGNNAINKTNVNYLTDLRKNFELNIKQLRNHSNRNFNTNQPRILNLKNNLDNNDGQPSASNKTNLGVLV